MTINALVVSSFEGEEEEVRLKRESRGYPSYPNTNPMWLLYKLREPQFTRHHLIFPSIVSCYGSLGHTSILMNAPDVSI
jgi:hypothetical protein